MCKRGILTILDDLGGSGLPPEEAWQGVADGFGIPRGTTSSAPSKMLTQSCPICGQKIPIIKRVLESSGYNLPDVALYQSLCFDAPCIALGLVVPGKTTESCDPRLRLGLTQRWQGGLWQTFGVAFVGVVEQQVGVFEPMSDWAIGSPLGQLGVIAQHLEAALKAARADGQLPLGTGSRAAEKAVETVISPHLATFGFSPLPRRRIFGYWCSSDPDGIYGNGSQTIAIEVKVTEDWEHPTNQPFRYLLSHNAVLKIRLAAGDHRLPPGVYGKVVLAEKMLEATGRAACICLPPPTAGGSSPGRRSRPYGTEGPAAATDPTQ